MGLFDGIADALSSAADSVVESVGNFTDGFNLGDVATPLIGAAGSYLGQTNANQANKDLARQANEFTAQQYASRYQTTVKDLKAAGLNPMLAYSQLGGGSPSSVAPPRMENAIGNAANTALTTMQLNTNLKQNALLESQALKTDTEADNIAADTMNKRDINPNIKKEFDRIIADTELKRMIARNASASTAATYQDIAIRKPEEWAAKTYGKTKQGAQDFIQTLSGAGDAVQKLKGRKAPTFNYTTNYGIR